MNHKRIAVHLNNKQKLNKEKQTAQQLEMQQITSLPSKIQQKPLPKDTQQPPLDTQLFTLYETRLKSLIETLKVYQQTLAKDNQSGALAFMNTPELATYRIDREYELLKDVLLSQKQRLLIKALTSYHQLKKENLNLKNHSSNDLPKNPFSKSQHEMAAEKDVMLNNRMSIDKESRISNKNSNSRLSIVTQANQANTGNISVYERLLQEKITLIKELEKKNRHLGLENEQQRHKITQLQANLQKFLTNQMGKKQCQECASMKQLRTQLTNKYDLLSKQNERNKLKLREEQSLRMTIEGQLQVKQLKLQENSMKLDNLQKQLQIKNEQQQQQKTSKPVSNLHTINQLKQKLIIQEQQLMSISNSFSLLKEDISESLLGEVTRLKNAHLLLKEQIKAQVQSAKKQTLNYVNEIITAVRLKNQSIKTNEEIAKKLRQIDNQLDYFIQQKHIKI